MLYYSEVGLAEGKDHEGYREGWELQEAEPDRARGTGVLPGGRLVLRSSPTLASWPPGGTLCSTWLCPTTGPE